jgi:membrane-associated phospholipid phosphatase
MPVLQATHVEQVSSDHFGSVYAGYLESMFAGVGAEWLYRPWHSRLALGVDINHVQQRNFEQNFGLRSYSVNTGHASAYWDTGFANTLVKLQVGKYLAGDLGATLDVSRRFNNGVAMGVYATKTNVSAQQFGEGSFDKGIYLSLPFDVMLPKYTDRSATITWQPLTRDGGARLQRQHELYNITAARDSKAFSYASKDTAVQDQIRHAQDLATFTLPQSMKDELSAPPSVSQAMHSVVASASQTAQQLTHPDSWRPWALGAGLVLASSALDEKANRWALRHSGSSGVAKLGNSIPLLLGLAALSDLGENGVGWTALQAGGFAYAANSLLKVAVGRARPEQDKGSKSYDALSAQGLKSSFASNHTAVAFALATTIAQTYDLPWLYGAAGLTALGRVQSHQHWLSDTVAGGVLGYAIGSVMSDEHKLSKLNNKSGRQVWLSPNGIAAKWWSEYINS